MPRRQVSDSMKTGLRILYIMNYLMENTNEYEKRSAAEIIEYFSAHHHVAIDRKTIYADIGLLNDYFAHTGSSMRIEYYRNVKNPTKQGYHLINRDFSINDLTLIADCVQASKFITQNRADVLTGKLKRLTRKQDSSTLDRRNYVENRVRSDNENVFKDNQIDNIHKAIATKKKISFQYLKYNLNKSKVPSREKDNGFYDVSPYALVWSDSQYYMVGFVGRRRINFRVDRMDHINILDDNITSEKEMEALNLEGYSTKLFSMFTGKRERVQIKFRNELINVAIDRFGMDVRIMAE